MGLGAVLTQSHRNSRLCLVFSEVWRRSESVFDVNSPIMRIVFTFLFRPYAWPVLSWLRPRFFQTHTRNKNIYKFCLLLYILLIMQKSEYHNLTMVQMSSNWPKRNTRPIWMRIWKVIMYPAASQCAKYGNIEQNIDLWG